MVNVVPVIVSSAVVAVSGYFIYRALKKPKTELIVQYYSAEDMQAAGIIKDALKPEKFVSGWLDVRIIDKPLVVIGGRYANPVYGDLVNLGVMPEIVEGDTNGHIYVKTYSGQTIYGVVGDLAQHTLAAANYIKENGLPTTDVTI